MPVQAWPVRLLRGNILLFSQSAGGPERYRMSDEKRRVLQGYQFSLQPRGNFFIEIMRPQDENYEPTARFLLTVLYEAYDVRLGNPLRIDVHPELDASQPCKLLPVS